MFNLCASASSIQRIICSCVKCAGSYFVLHSHWSNTMMSSMSHSWMERGCSRTMKAFDWLCQSSSRYLVFFICMVIFSAAIMKCAGMLPICVSRGQVRNCIFITITTLRILHYLLSVPILPAPWIHRSHILACRLHYELTHDSRWHSEVGSMLVSAEMNARLRELRRQGARG